MNVGVMQCVAAAAINASLLRMTCCENRLVTSLVTLGFLFPVFLGQLGNGALLHLHV